MFLPPVIFIFISFLLQGELLQVESFVHPNPAHAGQDEVAAEGGIGGHQARALLPERQRVRDTSKIELISLSAKIVS